MYEEDLKRKKAVENYWLKKLSGELPNIYLPLANDDSMGKSQERSNLEIEIPEPVMTELLKIVDQSDVGLFIFFLSGLTTLLNKYTGVDDLVIGTVNPKKTGVKNKLLFCRQEVTGELTFKELVIRMKQVVIEAFNYSDYSFGSLFQKLMSLSGTGTPGIFNAAFIYDGIQERINSLNQFNLVLVLSRREERWELQVEYNSSLYPAGMIERFSRNFVNFFKDIKEKVDHKLPDLNILSPGERAELLEINETGDQYPLTATIHELFEKQAAMTPNHVALVYKDHQLTYAELNARANQLARTLRKKNFKGEHIIGLMMDRSVEMIIGIIGILKEGGAYLPIDPETPVKRIALMLDECNVSLLLSQGHILERFKYTSLKGLQTGNAQIHLTSPRERITDFDGLLFPDRSLVNYEIYNRYIGQALVKNRIMIQASRGCPHNCVYCYKIWPSQQAARSGENILQEIQLYYDLGIRKFDIFMLNFKEGKKLLRLIIENKEKNLLKDLELYFPNGFGFRGDLLDREYIDLAARAGTVNLALALETASPRLQKLINKQLDLEKFRENVEYFCKQYPGIILELFTMHGIPTETEEEAMMTLDFIKSLKWVHFPYVNVLKIYQNTGMEKLALENGVSRATIVESEDMAWHEWSDTLPFNRSFTTRYQANFLSEYVLSRERLISVLPHQMKILTRDELIEKYDSYLPQNIKHFSDLLELAHLRREELAVKDFRDQQEDELVLTGLDKRLKETFPRATPSKDALRVLLLDLSQFFTHQGDMLYDVVDVPLGLMYLLTHLNRQLGDQVKGKILKARIDFDSYEKLKQLLEEFKPGIIGVRSLSYYKDFFHETISRIRQWGVDVPIITGGPYATVDSRTLLQDRNIDLAVLGEGESTFCEIVKSILKNHGKLPGKETLKKIPGIAFVQGEEGRLNRGGREIMVWREWEQAPAGESGENPPPVNQASHLAYVIFTSGSTGKPKGVPIEHKNAVNVLNWFTRAYQVREDTHVIQLSNYTFDPSVEQIFAALSAGGVLYLPQKELIADSQAFHQYINRHQVNMINFVPGTLGELLGQGEPLKSLKAVISGGEKLEESLKKQLLSLGYGLYNQYGPTETTIDALQVKCSQGKVVLGKPIANVRCYILGKNNHLTPIGITGEIHIGGTGVTRGYLNNPVLTAERFVDIPHLEKSKLYRTGDYGRYLPNRDIEFLGRMDHQVKVKGYRIELGEITTQLLNHHEIKEAVVTAKQDERGENYLCAYVTASRELTLKELSDHLSRYLPYYMIPQYLVQLEQMPLTSSGKIDRESLPDPTLQTEVEYTPPGDHVQRTLARIWAELLDEDEEKISINANFFEMGGQSLKATVLMSKIHKAFNVKLTLAEIFKTPTIGGLSQYINRTAAPGETFTPIEPVEKKEYHASSSAQKRMYIIQQMDLHSTVYNIFMGIQLGEGFQVKQLEQAIKKLVQRHESLRTSFHLNRGEVVQKVNDYVHHEFKIGYYQFTDSREASEFEKNFVRHFDLSQAPLIRMALLEINGGVKWLVDMHHIISDGVSQDILAKDFLALYEEEPLPPLRVQYKDFSRWQNSEKETGKLERQEVFWLKEFEELTPPLELPLDYARPGIQTFEGDIVNFEIGERETALLKQMALREGATLYMVLLSLYNILFSKLGGQEDIAVGTPIAGRKHADLHQIIGMFVNILVLRNFPQAGKTFSGFLGEVKERTLSAFENQDYQFEDLVDRVATRKDMSRNPIFDLMFSFEEGGSNRNAAKATNRPKWMNQSSPSSRFDFEINTAKFDLTLSGSEVDEKLSFSLQYRTKLFKEATIKRLTRYFKNIAAAVLERPQREIAGIDFIPAEEKRRLIVEFNSTRADYPPDKTIRQLFEAQVEQTRDHLAVTGPSLAANHLLAPANAKAFTTPSTSSTLSPASIRPNIQVTYQQLNKKSNQASMYLKQKGCSPGTIAGIMLEPSVERISAILAVLKAGGAYLPIDPDYPSARVHFMLADCNTSVLITSSGLLSSNLSTAVQGIGAPGAELPPVAAAAPPGEKPAGKRNFYPREIIIWDEAAQMPAEGSAENPAPINRSGDLSYVIFTSGSTGIPRGVMIEHRALVNLSYWHNRCYEVNEADHAAAYAGFGFDASVWEIFPYLVKGAALYIIKDEIKLDIDRLARFYKKNDITISFLPTQFCQQFMEKVTDLPSLRILLTGGEKLRRFTPRLYRLYNNYGPTENTVVTTVFPVEAYQENIPVGKPVNNVRVYILDKNNLQLKPVGAAGELCISGHGLSRGYLNSPELTAEKFDHDLWDYQDYHDEEVPFGRIINAFAEEEAHELDKLTRINQKLLRGGEKREAEKLGRWEDGKLRSELRIISRPDPETNENQHKRFAQHIGSPRRGAPGRRRQKIYKTGDLARWLPDGNIQFLGRIDHQVKLRGFRIELGEIECQLVKYPGVSEAVAALKGMDGEDKFLCAYIITDGKNDGDNEKMKREIKEYLARELPEHMIPAYITFIERMPLTPGGKVDRKALPQPEVKGDSEYTGPGDKLEENLVKIWSEVLALEKNNISINGNFFRLGGHSLKATQLIAKIHKELKVKIPLAEFFQFPTIRGLARIIKISIKDQYIPIEPVEEKEYYELSPAQKRLYILQRMDVDSTAYNMPHSIPLAGETDAKRLEKAFTDLIKRHEILRTSFSLVNEHEEPVQRVHKPEALAFSIAAHQIVENRVEEIHKNFVKPFDLSQAPLLRAVIIEIEKAGKNTRLLLLDMHHIITDGTSQTRLEEEFVSLHRGETLAPLRLQYKDFSRWQNRQELQQLLKDQEKYWCAVFTEEAPVLTLPTDYPRPVQQGFEGKTVDFILSEPQTRALKEAAEKADATLYMSILAVYTVLLHKLSGQEDIIVGTPIAARRHEDLEPIIGMFVNTLAMRNYPTGDKTFDRYLREVKACTLGAFENQEYQFELLVEKVAVRRDTSRNPIFDVMLNLLNESDYTGTIPEINEQEENDYRHRRGTSKFDLNLAAVEIGTRVLFSLEYSTALYKPATIERFIGYFKEILRVLSVNPGTMLSGIDILTNKEKAQVLEMSMGIEAIPGESQTIHRLFEEQASRTPGQVALVYHDMKLTYKELDDRSNRLANLLRQRGVQEDSVVGLMLDRSLELITGLLAVLKAGGAYLPIDVEYPEERKRYMLQDSGVSLVLTNYDIETQRGSIPVDIDVIDLDNTDIYSAGKFPVPGPGGRGTDIIYVIYTSGTSGQPKGVILEHRNLVNLVKFQHQYTNIDSSKILQFATISFDASIHEICSALLTGGTLYLIDKEDRFNIPGLFRLITRNEIKTVFLPMSFIKLIFRDDDYIKLIPHCITHIQTAGEQVVVDDHIRNFLKSRAVYFHNHYGPSEAHVVTTLTLAPTADIPGIPSIGKPVSNTWIYVLDKARHLLPIGVAGELVIGGIQVGRGYLNRPELTKEKFGTDKLQMINKTAHFRRNSPYIHTPPLTRTRFYHTGDLSKWRPDGNIEFLGRLDHQVKIRGYRIEPEEIEVQLLKHPGIKEAVVLAREESRGDKYICAYTVSDSQYEISELREFLSKELPDYMIPSYFVPIEKVPLTLNGKIDRKLLPVPKLNASKKYEAPGDTVEVRLLELWSEVLGIEKEVIGIYNNFFQLGGHSLKAIVLAAKMHKVFDVKVPLIEIFKMPRIKDLAAYIKAAIQDEYHDIEAVEEKEYYPLSSTQKRLYILHRMNPGNTAYNMPEIIPLPTEFDLANINETFNKMIKRHASLRTSFHMVDDTPVQVVHDEVGFEIEYKKVEVEVKVEEEEQPSLLEGTRGLAPLPLPAARSPQPATALINSFIRPFDLSRAPLLRVGLLKTGEDSHLLLVDMHHIISDGVSHGILVKDFLALNAGEELLPLRLQYKDFSEWQNGETDKESIKRQEEYWLKEFAAEIPVLELPTDYPRPLEQSFEGDSVDFEISTEETHSLNTLALTGGSTLFMVLVAVVNILLSKLSGQEEIIIGTPIAGRRHADLEKIIGMFVNTLSLRNYPAGDRTFREFLGEVKERMVMVFENQEYPFEELVDKLSVKRDITRNPLFDIMFVLQNMNTDSRNQDKEVEIETRRSVQPDLPKEYENIVQTTKFDLTLRAIERGHGLSLLFEYCTKLFKKETMERFIAYFKKIVSVAIKEPGIRLSEIEIISEEEKKQILKDFNETGALYPKAKTIHQLFEEQVEQTPDKVAVIGSPVQTIPGSSLQISYRELNEKSNRLAGLLQVKGIAADTMVAIMIEPCIEMMAGILAVLKCGSCYLPIDPLNPGRRIEFLLTDSEAKFLLTHPPLTDKVNVDIEILSIADEFVYTGETREGRQIANPDDVVYIIYTSGTMGNPKGVQVKHENLVNYVTWFSSEIRLTPDDKTALTSSFAFDLGYSSIYPSLLNGAQLHLLSKEIYMEPGKILNYINRQGITYLKMTPSLFSTIIMHHDFSADTCRRLRLVVLGGEAINTSDVEKAYRICTHLRIMNHYGPTEMTIGCIAQFIERGDLEAYKIMPTIGRPIFNNQVYILDKYLNLVPVGTVGELCISGAGLAKGYFKREELTGEKFVKIEKIGNIRLYRTGDLGRWLSNGNIEFLGRIDHQVKIRGFRVELGEIENCLKKHPGIKEAVLVAWEEEGNREKYLCAYIVADKDCEYESSEIREFLLKELPDYMVPSYFVPLEKIPLTPNGKINRDALLRTKLKTELHYLAPRNDMEVKLVGLWAEVLNIQPDVISIDKSFFELGGHSLKATVLASKIYKELNVILPLVEIFKSPTIMKLSEYIINTNRNIQKDIDGKLVLLKEGPGKNKHLFFIHDGTGEVEGYVEFCKYIANDFNCWGLRADRLENLAPRNVTIRELAATYIETMKKIQPHGPFYIAGWSLGGTIAFEMAAQLENNHDEIAFLALMDSPPPQGKPGKSPAVFEFNLESELDYIKEYLPGRMIRKMLKELTDSDTFWPLVVKYLETNNYDVERIKKIIMEFGMRALPNFNRLSIRESVYYLNIGRTLQHAREMYTPPGKIHTPVHYFAASESKGIIDPKQWNQYTETSAKFFQITGDHLSIFKMPNAQGFAELVDKILKELDSKP